MRQAGSRAGAPAANSFLPSLSRSPPPPALGSPGKATAWRGWRPCVYTLHHTWESLSADVSEFLGSCVTIATPATRKPRHRAPVGTQDPAVPPAPTAPDLGTAHRGDLGPIHLPGPLCPSLPCNRREPRSPGLTPAPSTSHWGGGREATLSLNGLGAAARHPAELTVHKWRPLLSGAALGTGGAEKQRKQQPSDWGGRRASARPTGRPAATMGGCSRTDWPGQRARPWADPGAGACGHLLTLISEKTRPGIEHGSFVQLFLLRCLPSHLSEGREEGNSPRVPRSASVSTA